jgi:hypothetical protein
LIHRRGGKALNRPVRSAIAICLAIWSSIILGACRGKNRTDIPDPAFIFSDRVRSVSYGIPTLFSLPVGVSQQTFARLPGGYLAWNAAERILLSFSAKGEQLGSWPLDTAEAWFGEEGILAREGMKDTTKGFRFVLYRASLRAEPRPTWHGWLDCQVSDALVRSPKRAYVAGEVRAGDAPRLGAWSEGRGARPPRGRIMDDSLRLIDLGHEIVAFASSKLREKRPYRLYSFRPVDPGNSPNSP